MEEIQIKGGKIRNPSFTDYLIPTILDMPPMRIDVLEYADPHAPYGVRGVGEPPTISSGPAIVAAIREATGLAAEPGAGAARAHHRHLMPPASAARTDHGGMTAGRHTPALLPGAGGVLAIVLLAACSGAATTLCGSQSVAVSGGAYTVMNNEWHSGAPQCITTGGDASFTVTSSSIAVIRHGTPGGYPFIYKGCHWGACTPGSGLPIQVSAIHAGTVITSWRTAQPRGSSVYDVTYDIWFNQAPTTKGQPDGAELMIWLNHHGHVHPPARRWPATSASAATTTRCGSASSAGTPSPTR